MTKKMRDALRLQDCLGRVIHRERECLNEILDLIIEAEACRAFLELGYSSLLDWLTQYFKYSTTAALRRIASARLKRSVPALHEKIQTGAVNLTTVAKTQSAIRAEENRTGTKMSADTKASLIEKIEGKSGDQTDRILMTEFPNAQICLKEKVKVINAEEVTLQVVMCNADYEVFLRTKELLSHSVPNGSLGSILAILSRDYNSRKDPLMKAARVTKGGEDSKPGEATSVGVGHGLRTADAQNSDKTMMTACDETTGSTGKSGNAEKPGSAGKIESGESTFVSAASIRVPSPRSAEELNRVAAPHSNASSFRNAKIERRTRYIPRSVRLEVLNRDQSICQFKNHETGKKCGSSYQVEVDHIKPFALGGSHEVENLRCLCAQHNRYRAEATFGSRQASMF